MKNPVRSLFGVSAKWLCAAAAVLVAAVALEAGPAITQGHFDFVTYSVASANPLDISAEGINNFGVTVGGFQSATSQTSSFANPWIGYERFAGGKEVTFVATGDTYPTGFGFTRADGINDEGTVVGEFYDDTASTPRYRGFFYKDGKFTPYDAPNGLSTDVTYINDAGDFCGWAVFANGNAFDFDAFIVVRGVLTTFSAPGADPTRGTFCLSINIWGQAAGFYDDSQGVSHGFLRETNGDVTRVDAPGASTTLPSSPTPCTQGNKSAGTQVEGLNDFGELSGHFYTSSNDWHGFVRYPYGPFLQIDVPGASETGGGNVNDLGQVTGHFIAGSVSTCQQRVFIATPDLDRDGDD